MKLLAHRGIWHTLEEKNTRNALSLALTSGWGIETDIRDLNGELVISHDMPLTGALPLEAFLCDYSKSSSQAMLALNIKADGLSKPLLALLEKYSINRYFCFDMSIPETLNYLSTGLNTYVRVSEYEQNDVLLGKSHGIWFDGFKSLTFNSNNTQRWLLSGKGVCVVSPELHGRDPSAFWHSLKELPFELLMHPNFMLCTDHPDHVEGILQ